MWGLLAGSAAAGPWVHPPGAGYTKLAVHGSTSAAGELRTRCGAASVYGERGVWPGAELVFELPYLSCANRLGDSALAYRTHGLGTARVGLGVAPARGAPVAVHAAARVPLSAPAGTPLDPPLGDSQVDLELVVSGGGSAPVGPHRAWGLVEVGGRDRTNLRLVPGIGYPGAEGTYRAQLGLASTDLGWLQVEAQGQVDLRGGRALHRAGCGVAARLSPALYAEVGLYRTYAARGASPGSAISVGLSHLDR